MKRFFLAAAAVLLAALTLSCSSDGGWVRVKGNKFIDPQGKEIVFRGLCFSDPVKLVREGQWNERYFAVAIYTPSVSSTIENTPCTAPVETNIVSATVIITAAMAFIF